MATKASERARGRRRRARVPLLVGLALALGMVLVAPVAPASAYVQPYGRYDVVSYARPEQCLTVPFNGVPGTYVVRADCDGQAGQVWHFDRVGSYTVGSGRVDPVFVIRATHRGVGGNGEYADCLDLYNSEVYTGHPVQTWHCNGGAAQQWHQLPVGWYGDTQVFAYESMVAPGSRWVLTFNSGDAYPHLVMAAYNGSPYQWFWQNYVGP